MSTNKPDIEKQTLQTQIDYILEQMSEHHTHSEEYAQMVEQLEKLHKMRATEKVGRPSADVMLNVFGSLAGIIAIVGFEKANVVTSKALGFVLKTKV